jgi:Fur family ferric uptake transcriptional regulator
MKELLKKSNLKYTKQREIILKFLSQNSKHFTTEEIYNAIKKEHTNMNIGLATIYRTLNTLEEVGIVSSISFGISGKKFEFGIREHHDHMICNKCSNIIEFLDEDLENLQKNIAIKYNFLLQTHNMQLFGICQECQNKTQ